MKELIRKVLINKYINKLIVRPLRLYKNILPFKYLSRLPVIGEFSFKNLDGASIKYTSNGFDPTANLLYWSEGKLYEPHIINLLHLLGKDAKILFDVGANTGVITLHMAILPNVTNVYAFEPLPKAYEILNKNIELNGLKNCHTYPIALSDVCGHTKFFIPNVEAIPTSSSLEPDFYEDHSEILISTDTIDHFVDVNQIDQLDIVKIDVEGGELKVFAGMKATIEKLRPYIICEILPRTGDFLKMYEIIKPYRYYAYEIDKNQLNLIKNINGYQRNNCIDFLFSPVRQADYMTVY